MFREYVQLFLEQPLKKGEILYNRYEILQFIGMGSYGIVYKAQDNFNNNKYMIVKQSRRKREKLSKLLLKREAEMLQTLQHPQIPTCLNFFDDEDQRHTLLMEFMEGKNFEDLVVMDGQEYSEMECLAILLKVLSVVEYIHDQKIVHRDLRLPNIICHNKEISIIDFGLALPENEQDDLTFDHKMAIEKKWYREPIVESDFYALGHFLLFLLYSSYKPSSSKEKSWEEELPISMETKKVIRKLLKIDPVYNNCRDIVNDIYKIFSKA